jgi:hypothetical protein
MLATLKANLAQQKTKLKDRVLSLVNECKKTGADLHTDAALSVFRYTAFSLSISGTIPDPRCLPGSDLPHSQGFLFFVP